MLAAHKGEVLTTIDQSADFGAFTLDLAGRSYMLHRDPAVFAHGELDDATAMLIAALEIAPGGSSAGSGMWRGFVGDGRGATRHRGGDDRCRGGGNRNRHQNCAANNLINTRVVAADINDTIADERFRLSCAIHRSISATSRSAVSPSVSCKPRPWRCSGGRGYFVMNRFLAYESRFSAIVGESVEVAGDDRYKVLVATRRKA